MTESERLQPTATTTTRRPRERETFAESAGNSLLSGVLTRAVSVGTCVTLACLLTPDDFGLQAMVWTVTGLLGICLEIGFSQALVQFRDLSGELFSTALWVNLGLGALLAGGVFAGAGHLASFYAEPSLVEIARTSCAILVLAPLSSIHGAVLQRLHRFRTIARIEVFSALLASFVGIAVAVRGHGVWALVGHVVTLALGRAVLYTALCPIHANCGIDRAAVRRLWRYGRYVLATNVFNHTTHNVDQVLVGRFMGSAVLGPYRYAWQLVSIPQDLVSRALNSVLVSRYSELQTDVDELRQKHLDVLRVVAFLAVPIYVLAIALADRLVHSILGARWEGLVVIVRYLGAVELIQILGAVNGPLFLALGKTRRLLVVNLLRLNVVVGVLIGVCFGLEGLLIGLLVARMINFLPSIHFGVQLLGLSVLDVFRAVWRSFAVGASLLVVLFVLSRSAGAPVDSPGTLAGIVASGLCIYALLSRLLDPGPLTATCRVAVSLWRRLST